MKAINSSLVIILIFSVMFLVFASMNIFMYIVFICIAFVSGALLYKSYKKLGADEFEKTILFSNFINE